jgi:uncharacterized protein (TIGR04255 family)
MKSALIEIRTDEVFETFLNAPIVEAIIDIRARAMTDFDEASLRAYLEAALTGYNFLDSRLAFQHEFEVEGGKLPVQSMRDLGWKGLRFQSGDNKQIIQFNLDGFVFSRLHPYLDWAQLAGEGMRLWNVFQEFAQPIEIHRIGLRFINRVVLPPGELKFEDYIHPAPAPPGGLDLPFLGYMHQDMLAVPGFPYAINVIQTIQLPHDATAEGVALILDIDVFTTQGFELEDAGLSRRLEEMRWMKNKVFFGNITEKAKELFR